MQKEGNADRGTYSSSTVIWTNVQREGTWMGPRLMRGTMLWRLRSSGYGVRYSWVQILSLSCIRYVTLNNI